VVRQGEAMQCAARNGRARRGRDFNREVKHGTATNRKFNIDHGAGQDRHR
jgi:hypothetical protein